MQVLATVSMAVCGHALPSFARWRPGETLQRLGHAADFVLPVQIGDRALRVTPGQPGHAPGQVLDRGGNAGGDAARYQQHAADNRDGQHGQQPCLLSRASRMSSL
jgi:hypothetical protein